MTFGRLGTLERVVLRYAKRKTWRTDNTSEIFNVLLLLLLLSNLANYQLFSSPDGNNNLRQLAAYGFTTELLQDLVLKVDSFPLCPAEKGSGVSCAKISSIAKGLPDTSAGPGFCSLPKYIWFLMV